MQNSEFITQKIEVSPSPTITKPKFRTHSLRPIERKLKRNYKIKKSLGYVRVKVKIMCLFDVTDFWAKLLSFLSISLDQTGSQQTLRMEFEYHHQSMLTETGLMSQKLTIPQEWHPRFLKKPDNYFLNSNSTISLSDENDLMLFFL